MPNFNKNDKNNNRDRKKNNNVEIPVYFPDDMNDDIYNEIIDVLNSTKFNNISIPFSIYRTLIDDSIDSDDTRVSNAGFIKRWKYDPKPGYFVISIFNSLKETIAKLENPVFIIHYTEYDGKLGTITKIVLSKKPE